MEPQAKEPEEPFEPYVECFDMGANIHLNGPLAAHMMAHNGTRRFDYLGVVRVTWSTERTTVHIPTDELTMAAFRALVTLTGYRQADHIRTMAIEFEELHEGEREFTLQEPEALDIMRRLREDLDAKLFMDVVRVQE